MTKYSFDYQLTHDIDCFATVCGKMIHIASNGAIIPHGANDREVNNKIRKEIASYVGSRDHHFKKNDRYIRQRILQSIDGNITEDLLATAIKNYEESFVMMAKLGFYSFDRYIDYNHRQDNREDNTKYVLIAIPECCVSSYIESLPSLTIHKDESWDADFEDSEINHSKFERLFSFTYRIV